MKVRYYKDYDKPITLILEPETSFEEGFLRKELEGNSVFTVVCYIDGLWLERNAQKNDWINKTNEKMTN